LLKRIERAYWNNIAKGLFVLCSSGVAHFRDEEDAFITVRRAIERQILARRAGGNRVRPGPLELPQQEVHSIMRRLLHNWWDNS
jgi:hypothetical protein